MKSRPRSAALLPDARIAARIPVSFPPAGLASCCRLQRQRVELGRQIGQSLLTLHPSITLLVPACFVPKLEAITLTNQHAVPIELRELAQLGWQEKSPVPVELQFGCRAHHEPL